MLDLLLVNSVALNNNIPNTPVGLLSLATELRANNYKVEILDIDQEVFMKRFFIDVEIEGTFDTVVRNILSYQPMIVGFHTMCATFLNTINIAKKLKSAAPSIPIILGGPQASVVPNEIMKECFWVDFISIGESEDKICILVDAIINGGDFSLIHGLYYREGNNIVSTKCRHEMLNLDNIRRIDYSIIKISEYSVVSLDVGRGCPFNCTYCSTSFFWGNKFRIRCPENVFNEIKYLVNTFGIRSFEFVHDLFTLNRTIVVDLCNLIISDNLHISWTCSARIDTIDSRLVSLMEKAGCRSIYLGIESGSQYIQEIIGKKLNLADVWKRLLELREVPLNYTISFIYGFPQETLDDFLATMELIKKLYIFGFDHIQLHLLSIIPGTQMFSKYYNKLELTKTVSDFSSTANLGAFKALVMSNKTLYSQYYDINTIIRSKYKEMNTFITYILSPIYSHFKKSFYALFDFFSGSIVAFFEYFILINIDFVNEIFSNEKKLQSDVDFVMQKKAVELVKKAVRSINDARLFEIFQFEEDRYFFLYSDLAISQKKKYAYQIWKLNDEFDFRSLEINHGYTQFRKSK